MHSIVKLLSLISFLLLSFQATSQSVIASNGDTLIYIPQKIARQVIVDLEKGDLCQKELESYLRDIESLNQAITAKDGQISNLIDTKNNLNGVIDQKNSQIERQEKSNCLDQDSNLDFLLSKSLPLDDQGFMKLYKRNCHRTFVSKFSKYPI